jgi:type VI secretion system protein ImpG
MLVRPTTRPIPWQHQSVGAPLAPVGFEDDEALLPYGPRSFQGYRLLQEYFAFPARYLFVKLLDLRAGLQRCDAQEAEILLLSDVHEPSLDGVVNAQHFALHCTPAVNLFPRRADRIHLSEATHEYHVVPDRTRPMDFEVHSIREVVGFGSSNEIKQPFHPFFAWNDQTADGESPAYFTIQRQPRALSTKQRARGARSSYVGSEVFLSLVDADEGPYRPTLRQLAVETICTNRDLPLHLSLGQGRTDFTLDSGAPVEAIRCLTGPSPPRPSHAYGDLGWRLISHLSLNYLSLVDPNDGAGQKAQALRELLSLYADLTDAGARKQIDGIRSTACTGITRALPVPGPTTFGRGMEVTLTCDETAFEGSGAFVLGGVLERFFAKYVSLNSFTETVLRTVQRGEIMRWQTRAGRRKIL